MYPHHTRSMNLGGGVPQRPKAPIPAGRLVTEDLNLRLRVSSMSANYAYALHIMIRAYID